jgi:hypothetical protein
LPTASGSFALNYLQPHTQGISDGLTYTTTWTDAQGGDSIESNTRQSKNSGKGSKNTTTKGKKLKKLSANEPEAVGKSGSAEKQPLIQEREDSTDVGQDELDTSRVTVEQTDSLNGSNTESTNVSSDPKCNEVTLKSKIEIQEDHIKMEGAQLNSLSTPSFSFTQYAADSPYPAASLNFSSVWNNLLPQGERKDSKVTPTVFSSSSMYSKVHEINPTNIKKEVVGSDYIAPIDTINNMNSGIEPSLIKSEIVAEEDSLTNDSEDVSVPSFNNNQSQSRTSNDEGNSSGNVRTVETIADLQKALKDEDDVQIVVPNELLETTEFKTFISNFNSFPINDRHQNVPPLSSSSKESKSSNVKREMAENPSFQQTMEGVIPAPPNNTPVTTRPPSVEIPEDRVVLNRVEYIENAAQNHNKGIEGYVSRVDITTTDATKMVMRQGVLDVIPRNGQG